MSLVNMRIQRQHAQLCITASVLPWVGRSGLKIFTLAGGLLVADRQDQTIGGSGCMLFHCGYRFDGIGVSGCSAAEGNFPVWPSAAQHYPPVMNTRFLEAQFQHLRPTCEPPASKSPQNK